MQLTPQENFDRIESLVCPRHPDSPALLPGWVCPFDKWPEEELDK
jgi:hypothetical protein